MNYKVEVKEDINVKEGKEKNFAEMLKKIKKEDKKNLEEDISMFKKSMLNTNSEVDELKNSEKKLIDKKTECFEINKIINNIIDDNSTKKYSFVSKLKNIFNYKNHNSKHNNFLFLSAGGIGFLYSFVILFFIFSLFYNVQFVWGALSLASTLVLSFSLISLLHNNLEKNIKENEVNKIKENFEITEDQLLQISMFFDESDINKVKEINSENGRIYLKDIINIVKKKERWVLDNEDIIKANIKSQKIENILNYNKKS